MLTAMIKQRSSIACPPYSTTSTESIAARALRKCGSSCCFGLLAMTFQRLIAMLTVLETLPIEATIRPTRSTKGRTGPLRHINPKRAKRKPRSIRGAIERDSAWGAALVAWPPEDYRTGPQVRLWQNFALSTGNSGGPAALPPSVTRRASPVSKAGVWSDWLSDDDAVMSGWKAIVPNIQFSSRLNSEANGDFVGAVEKLKQMIANQAAKLASLARSRCQFDSAVARLAFGTGDVGLSHGQNLPTLW
jgi:hypothetical protein